MERLGTRVKRARLALAMTQDQLAEAISVKPQTISNLEAGRTKSLKLGKARKLAETLNLPLEDVVPPAQSARPKSGRNFAGHAIELTHEEFANLQHGAEKHGFSSVIEWIRYLATTGQSGALDSSEHSPER